MRLAERLGWAWWAEGRGGEQMGRGQWAEEVGWQRGFGGRGGLDGAMMGRGSDGQGER